MARHNTFLNLAFSSDAGYFIGLETAFASAIISSCKNTGTFNTYIVSSGITGAQESQLRLLASQLEQRCDVTVHVHWLLFDQATLARLEPLKDSITFYSRVVLADLLPGLDWVLWIDADIVFRKDLSGIDSYLKDGAPVAGAVDFALPTLGQEGEHTDIFNTRSLDTNLPYINTGFCVLNLNVWRKENIPDTIIAWSVKYQHLTKLHDQTSINWNLADRFAYLPEAYNTVVNKPTLEAEDFSNPVNLHFAGSLNPWQMHVDWTVKYAPRDLRYLFACYEFYSTRIHDMQRCDTGQLQHFLTIAKSGRRLLTSRKIRLSLKLRVLYHRVLGRKKRIARWVERRDFFCHEVPKQLDRLNRIIREIETAVRSEAPSSTSSGPKVP